MAADDTRETAPVEREMAAPAASPDDPELIAPPEAFAVCTGTATHRRPTLDIAEFAERIDALVWHYDVERDVYTYLSPGVEELVGVPRERLYEEPGLWFDLAHPDDSEWARAFCATATMQKQDHDFEYRIIHADGRVVWVRDLVTVVLDDDGEVCGLEGAFIDMTAHKALEEQAVLRAHEFATVFSLLKGVYYRLDRQGLIRGSSAAITGLSNGPLLQIAGHPIDAVLPRELADAAERGRRQVQSGARSWFEEVLQPAEGRRRLLEVSVFPLPVDDIAVIVRDITERLVAREAEERYRAQLKALASELETTAERERRRLAEEIHDRVSQTLAIARMRIMDRQALPDCPPEAEEVRRLVEQASREARALTSELAPVGLYELGLGAALRTLGESLTAQYGLRCTVDDRLPRGTAVSDDVLAFMFRATRELLMNVIKHAEASGAEVRLSLDDEMLRVTVRDDGKGAYVDPMDWTPGAGGGFGLFSVLERAQALGGDLDMRGAPGEGTIAVLSVPAADGGTG